MVERAVVKTPMTCKTSILHIFQDNMQVTKLAVNSAEILDDVGMIKLA